MNRSDLEYLVTKWDGELPDFMRHALFHRYLGVYPYVGKSPSVQELVGQPGAIAQCRR